MSEAFEYRGDDIPGTKDLHISYVGQKGGGGLLPHLSLI